MHAPGRRYLLRVTVTRGYGGSVVRDFFFWVRNHAAAPPPSTAPPIKARPLAWQGLPGSRGLLPFYDPLLPLESWELLSRAF